MKKTFRKALAIVAILGMGMSVTSCDSETITNILTNVLTLIAGGTTQTFTGTATQIKTLVREDATAETFDSETSGSDMSITTQFKVATSAIATSDTTTATLTIPTITVPGYTISNLEITAYYVNGTFGSLSEGYMLPFSCTITDESGNSESVSYEGEALNTSYYTYLNGTVTDSGAMSYTVSIINGTKAYNFDFTGSLVENAQ